MKDWVCVVKTPFQTAGKYILALVLFLSIATFVYMAIANGGSALAANQRRALQCSFRPSAAGIHTTRIPGTMFGRWSMIENQVHAKDASGSLIHPMLWSLWRWAETSPSECL